MARQARVPYTREELARIPVLTVSQTAQLFAVSVGTIRRYLKQGRIVGRQLNKQWYIPSHQFVGGTRPSPEQEAVGAAPRPP